MKFCTKCGNKVVDGQRFCTNCGYGLLSKKFDTAVIANETTSSQENIIKEDDISIPALQENKFSTNNTFISPPTNTNITTKLSKKSKIIIALVAILIILSVAFVQIGNSLTDPSTIVVKFEKAISSKNASDLSNVLYCNDTRVKLDSTSVAPLLAYFNDNPSYLNNITQSLNGDALDSKKINTISSKSKNTFSLVNVGNVFFIFPIYKVNVKPTFLDINAEVKDVSFLLNKKKIGTSDTDKFSKEFGPYVPGEYTLLANYKGKYISTSKPYTVDLVSASNGKSTVNVLKDLSYVTIHCDYSDAEIFVNGKDSSTKVSDATNFGPLNNNATIYATTIKDGRTLKSNQYTICDGDTDVYLNFNSSENSLSDTKTQLQSLLSNYTYYFAAAVNTNDTSLITPYVYPDSDIYKEQQSYIPSTYKANINEDIVNCNITAYNISDDNKSGTITTSETYNITKGGQSSNKTFNYIYSFKYNDSTATYQLASIKSAP